MMVIYWSWFVTDRAIEQIIKLNEISFSMLIRKCSYWCEKYRHLGLDLDLIIFDYSIIDQFFRTLMHSVLFSLRCYVSL